MSDPVTWMYIITAVGAGTAYASGVQQSNQAEAEADLAKINADQAAQQANAAEEVQRRRNRQFMAKQRAAIAEAGIGFGGTSEQLQIDSAVAAELDALSVRYEGTMGRFGFKNDASFARARSGSAMSGGYLSAAGQLLGGASDVYALKRG